MKTVTFLILTERSRIEKIPIQRTIGEIVAFQNVVSTQKICENHRNGCLFSYSETFGGGGGRLRKFPAKRIKKLPKSAKIIELFSKLVALLDSL